MQFEKIKKGLNVITIFNLESTTGAMFVPQKHIEARQPNAEGTVLGHVSGNGGEIWLVEHKDRSIGAYHFTEFYPA